MECFSTYLTCQFLTYPQKALFSSPRNVWEPLRFSRFIWVFTHVGVPKSGLLRMWKSPSRPVESGWISGGKRELSGGKPVFSSAEKTGQSCDWQFHVTPNSAAKSADGTRYSLCGKDKLASQFFAGNAWVLAVLGRIFMTFCFKTTIQQIVLL